MNVITLTDVKTQLEVTTTDHNTLLGELITDIISEVEGYLGMKIESVTSEVIYMDGGNRTLYLPHLNISDVTVWQDLDKDFADEDIADSDYYTVYGERGKIKRDDSASSWLRGNLVIKVQYSGGYTSATLPKDLKRKLIKQIAYEFRRRKDIGLQSVSFPDGSINKFSMSEWLSDVEDVLNRYRRITL